MKNAYKPFFSNPVFTLPSSSQPFIFFCMHATFQWQRFSLWFCKLGDADKPKWMASLRHCICDVSLFSLWVFIYPCRPNVCHKTHTQYRCSFGMPNRKNRKNENASPLRVGCKSDFGLQWLALLTCDNTGNLWHEALDSSDGHAISFILDSGDYVLNLPAERKNSLYEFSQVSHLSRLTDSFHEEETLHLGENSFIYKHFNHSQVIFRPHNGHWLQERVKWTLDEHCFLLTWLKACWALLSHFAHIRCQQTLVNNFIFSRNI